jgi:hypothetical protein
VGACSNQNQTRFANLQIEAMQQNTSSIMTPTANTQEVQERRTGDRRSAPRRLGERRQHEQRRATIEELRDYLLNQGIDASLIEAENAEQIIVREALERRFTSRRDSDRRQIPDRRHGDRRQQAHATST